MTSIPEHDLDELRHALRRVLRGLWRRRRATPELEALVSGDPPLGPRHVAVLAHVGSEGPRTVGEIAEELGLSLPAASKLTRELEDHELVRRSESVDDRRRTVVELNELTAQPVRAWLGRRNAPLEQALAQLSATERAAFVKGLRALADALMEESAHGPLRSHHRRAHRQRPHRHRPL
jgi:DNA-binding MarR family transcriptional regulator